jgi:hypothetical protein
VLDVISSPLGSVHATAVIVQRFAVVVRESFFLEQGATAAVEVLFVEAVCRLEFCGLVASSDGASVGRVHGDPVFGAVVDALDDVCWSQLCR